MSTEKVRPATALTTDVCRLSYVNLFEPRAVGNNPNGVKKYSLTLIIDKNDTATLAKMRTAIDAAAQIGKEKCFGGKIPANMATTLYDGDGPEGEDKPEYKGAYFLRTSSTSKPAVFDKYKSPITEQDEVYSGCWGRASLNFYAYNKSGNRGVACGLNAVQKIKDDDAFSGRGNAKDDFDEYRDEEDDLLG